ncbi:MAG: PLD nuclease N-terminal domain-containing protein [Candidatus Heimdallarchaeota archaeon]|nr:PLD nuclease N-terminal domain-containing protein [Candidatus Heimdallarchaeota archaeon]MDH5645609.1 PLD nuclease N-terminal domain-containing protein [Candidatus Heimdallarchaeota archaeon]
MELTTEILQIILPIIILELLLVIIAIIDWFKQPKDMTNRLLWLGIILFISGFGPIIYFLFSPRMSKDDLLVLYSSDN